MLKIFFRSEMISPKYHSTNIRPFDKKNGDVSIMTVNEKIKVYRQIKKAIASVTMPRLTAIAYYGQLQYSDRRTAERQKKREEIDKQFKADHFSDSPLTLAECIALKPQKQTAETKEFTRVNYTWDMLTADSDGSIITDLCKIITYCSCKKSVEREGTKTQYAMYYACCRAEWDHPDVADVLSIASVAMLETLAADKRQLEKDIYFLEKSVEMLKHLNPVIDAAEINKIVACCKRHCKEITGDYKANRRLVNRKSWMLKAVIEKSVDDLIHSVFLAVNNYLVSIRSIHVSDSFIVSSLEDDYEYYCNIPENETRIDLLFSDSDKKEKRQAILSAYHKVKSVITKSENETLKLLIRGYTVSQVAYKRKITKQCVNNQLCTIRSAFSRLIVSDPLEYAVIADCIVIDSDRQPKTDSTRTAEKKTDRQLETDRIKANMTDGLKDGIKEQVIQSLNDFDLKVYYALLNGTIRQTAKTLSKSKTAIGRIQTAIIKSVFDTIDYECKMTVNRDLFAKITLSELMQIFD